MISAHTMGNYIGEQHPEPAWKKPCPECGRPMHPSARRCYPCRRAHEQRVDVWSAVNLPDMLERHRRFELALSTGLYTIPELMARARNHNLPTRAEILCRAWWVKTGEQR